MFGTQGSTKGGPGTIPVATPTRPPVAGAPAHPSHSKGPAQSGGGEAPASARLCLGYKGRRRRHGTPAPCEYPARAAALCIVHAASINSGEGGRRSRRSVRGAEGSRGMGASRRRVGGERRRFGPSGQHLGPAEAGAGLSTARQRVVSPAAQLLCAARGCLWRRFPACEVHLSSELHTAPHLRSRTKRRGCQKEEQAVD
jgi:hypothetical protein